MSQKVVSLIALMMLTAGCDLHSHPEPYVIETTTSQNQPVVVEEVTVTETYTESYCSPVLEEYYAPYYHIPDVCVDYGQGVGYCCIWMYVDGETECSSEWCYWEDKCEWDFIIEECTYEYYEVYEETY